MRLYSKPEIKKPKDDQWYVSFNYVVPQELRPYYSRGTQRFKKYGDINMYTGNERDKNAQELRDDWEFFLKNRLYDPFQKERETLAYIEMMEAQIEIKEAEVEEAKNIKPETTEQQRRQAMSIYQAFERFIESRKEVTDNDKTVSTYRGTIKWLTKYFQEQKRLMDPVSSVEHWEIKAALFQAKSLRNWGNTTFNNELNLAMIVFNWLEEDYYIPKNPSSGRIKKLKKNITGHQWYRREELELVKKALIEADCMPVYRAFEFTYWICIRSAKELMKLKVGDIDRELKRVRFSADLSKDSEETYRDYTPEFEQVITDMNLEQYPNNFYVFGKNGVPSEQKCDKDYLSEQYRPIRDSIGLTKKHTIYAAKHTRTIHEMMKKTDPYKIQHLLRHDKLTTTMDYMRGFDLSLVNIYKPEDLKF